MGKSIFLTPDGITEGPAAGSGSTGRTGVLHVTVEPEELSESDISVILAALGMGLEVTYEGTEDERVCPCCHAYLFSEKNAYEICPVCGWEDDPSQRRDELLAGGANRLSLAGAREELWRMIHEKPQP